MAPNTPKPTDEDAKITACARCGRIRDGKWTSRKLKDRYFMDKTHPPVKLEVCPECKRIRKEHV